MGKEQELLDASRTGNITVIEKILSQRARRSGPLAPLASLRRSANPNCQDANGDAPLHHASLNGHKEAVSLLLQYEASANIMDNRGCFPLHLAAWSGNAEICKILLMQGPSVAKVNEQNNDGETALHCAAQYGHTDVVLVLQEHHADATIRNIRDESPLDLAAQYGRLEAVRLLLKKHPNLLCDHADTHSPIHLASRNGHRKVVQCLLEAGYDVNTRTETGSALHEAALFGKQDVVRLLLDIGVNPNILDSNHRTALDVVSEHKSHISLEIGKLVSEYIQEKERLAKQAARLFSENNNSSRASTSDCVYDDVPLPRPLPLGHRIDSLSSHGSCLAAAFFNKSQRHSGLIRRQDSRESSTSEGSSAYDTPPAPQRISSVLSESVDEPIYDTPVPVVQVPRLADTEEPIYEAPSPRPEVPMLRPRRRRSTDHRSADSPESSLSSTPSSKPSSPGPAAIMNKPSPKHSPTAKSPETPKKPPRRKTPSKQSPKPADSTNIATRDSTLRRQAPEKPKRTSLERKDSKESLSSEKSENFDDKRHSGSSGGNRYSSNSDDLRLDSSFEDKEMRITKESAKEAHLRDQDKGEEKRDPEKDASKEEKEQDNNVPNKDKRSSQGAEESSSEVVVEKTTPNSRPPSLEFSSKRSSRESIPLSPTGYEQPPTPDHPPPSPMTAVMGIQEKINPKEKRRSRDMETITESAFLAPDPTADAANVPPPKPRRTSDCQTETQAGGDSDSCACPLPEAPSVVEGAECCACPPVGGSINQVVKMRKSNVEIIANGNDPFLAECRECLTKGSIPVGQRRAKSQIYESLLISAAAKNRHKRISAPGLFVNFDPLDEKEEREECGRGEGNGCESCHSNMEDSDIDKLTDSGGGKKDVKSDGFTLREGRKKEESSPIDENEEWAKLANRLETPSSAQTSTPILSSCGGRMSTTEYSDYGYFEKRLQQIFQAEKGGKKIQSVGDWLDSLGLPQYENVLIANGYDDMDFMGPNVMEDTDLMEMGVISGEHRKKILDAASSLPPLKPIYEGAMPDSVEEWLGSLRLGEYLETFQRNNFNTMDRVRQLWELELNAVLDISTLGHKKRILASLKVPPDDDRWSHQSDEVVDIVGAIDWNTNPLSANAENSTSPAADINLFRDYTGVRPRPQARESSEGGHLDSSNGQLNSQKSGADLAIRPPHMAHSESPIRQWRHRPEVLIKGCCNYTAQYLGSTLVRQLQGTESTKESINKMKKSTETIAKIPTIILSISYKGVKFIDAKSKRVICEHEIGNIFCACQDGDNLNYFAYITKDLESSRHYCHVFCVRSTELATEIILTLGEAFEVAYQIALKERGEETSQDFEHTPCQTEIEDADTVSNASTGEIQSAAS